MNKEELKEAIVSKLVRFFGTSPEEADVKLFYRASALALRDILLQKRKAFKSESREKKTVYYMCMEFLPGRSLAYYLDCLGLCDTYRTVMKELGTDADEIFESEPDPALGNGGLGRLAACYIDSLSALGYPAMGYSILYEYGLFKQKIIDGMQVELPEMWLDDGKIWLIARPEKSCIVKMGGHIEENWTEGGLHIIHKDYEEIEAVPHDMLIYSGGECVNILRLWQAKSKNNFDMALFSQGEYMRSMEKSTNAEIISKVLYPSDNHTEGKTLRLHQQYFLSSASIQDIISTHLASYGNLDRFSELVAIHINDTHPTLCIPELMRILIDVYSYSWEDAFDIVSKTVSYTNHTVMPEALEIWQEDMIRLRLPRIYTIIKELNARFCARLWEAYPGDWNRISKMSIISSGQIRMANLCAAISHKINGVSALHTEILKKDIFKEFYEFMPEKFINVTNGVTHRRWLISSNPRLTALIDSCIGRSWIKSPEKLSELTEFCGDKTVLDRLSDIKAKNKVDFCQFLSANHGIALDSEMIFDVQIKRLHEYKRQLMNALNIIDIYCDLLDNPNLEITPRAHIFGAKAASGYYAAKDVINLIYHIGKDIDSHPKIAEKLRVVFPENYNVSMAQKLIPASEISEQISLAGKEASGTGNMKLMMNGAITIGTLDGANVEISEAVENVGDERNIFIFGLRSGEVEDLWRRGYHSYDYYHSNDRLKRIIEQLNFGFAGQSFKNISDYLITKKGIPDPFMCFADFESYSMCHRQIVKKYSNKDSWNKSSLVNIAMSGRFSSDMSIERYANHIWTL